MTTKFQLGDTVEFSHRAYGQVPGGRVRGVLRMWLGGDYYETVPPRGPVPRRYGRELTRVSDDLQAQAVNPEPEEREI
jgi:hypothetical protein